VLLVRARVGHRSLHKSFRIWVLRQEAYSTSTVTVAEYRKCAGRGGAGAEPQDGEAAFDEPVSDPPRTTVRRWNFALLGCTVLSRMTLDEAPQLV